MKRTLALTLEPLALHHRPTCCQIVEGPLLLPSLDESLRTRYCTRPAVVILNAHPLCELHATLRADRVFDDFRADLRAEARRRYDAGLAVVP